MDTKLLSTNIVAKRLGISRKTVIRLIDAGFLTAYDQGAGKIPRYFIPESEVENFKKNRRV